MLRILVVDDRAAFRQSFAFLLGREPGVRVVGQAGSLAGARPLLAGADLLLADFHLPDGDGAGLVAEFLALRPGARAVVVTASAEPDDHARALAVGALAVLDKLAPPAALIRDVLRLANPAPSA